MYIVYSLFHRISSMVEMGLVEKWIEKHWPESNTCENNIRAQAGAITVWDTLGAFLAFTFGLLLSILVFILEFKKEYMFC